ncbi:unnamed protein product [Prunus armeniaca]
MMWLEAVYKQDSFVRDKPHHLSLIVVQVDAHVHVLPQPVFQRMCYSSATACFGDSAEACVECFGDEKSGMVCSDDGTRIIFHRDVARGFFTSKYSVKYDCVDKKLKTMGVLHFQVSIKVRLRGQGTENNGIS